MVDFERWLDVGFGSKVSQPWLAPKRLTDLAAFVHCLTLQLVSRLCASTGSKALMFEFESYLDVGIGSKVSQP